MNWKLIKGDCVEEVAKMPADSIGYSIFSPPFASLYVYSDSPADMGNVRNDDEFFQHFDYLVPELLRVTIPGHCLSFHCMNLPSSKIRDGVIGLKDFRGALIAAFEKHGWIFHSEVCIWKDPVTAMQRTKAIGLLWKQVRKDSCMSRQGIPDYLVTMRKPGVNPAPVIKVDSKQLNPANAPRVLYAPVHPYGIEMNVEEWQQYASPVWMDIQPSKTLQSMREEQDERHICPLQLEVIERGIRLWSNPGDLILSPFAGIGSEGYVAIKMGREFIGVELKKAYYDQAMKNLARAESESKEASLFETGKS